MEEFIIIANKTLTGTDTLIYSNSKGAILKTILLYNTNETEGKATLTIDSVVFCFKVISGETKIITTPILSKNIKASGEGINIHITGLQLEG